MDQLTTSTTATITPEAIGSTAPRRARTSRRRSRLLVLLAPLLLLAAATPVQAYTITSRQNVASAPTIYKVQGRHYDVGSAVTGPMLKPWLYQPGPTLRRVGASGTESVRVTYSVLRWNGLAWPAYTSQTKNVQIADGAASAKAPALSILPNAGTGYYHVKLSITWISPIGAVIGSMGISMNQTGDYQCSTTHTCSLGQGFVFIGS